MTKGWESRADDVKLLGTLCENGRMKLMELVRTLSDVKIREDGGVDRDDLSNKSSIMLNRLKRLVKMELVKRNEDKSYEVTDRVLAGPGKCDIIANGGFDITSLGLTMKITQADGRTLILGTSKDVDVKFVAID